NQNTVSVTLQKGGKAPLTLAAQAYLRDFIDQGDSVVLIGTVGLTISVYDTYDVRPIPTAKDILGGVEPADSTGTQYTLSNPLSTQITDGTNKALVEATGQQKISLYDSSGNALASAA